jgi:hypothetical protein
VVEHLIARDYLMKEYLQLEGMVYKLVPIRTILTKDASP